jgi:hypothetical protein
MFLSGSGDRWHWSEDAFPPIDFCVYALLRDGLRVGSFDRHPEGDGTLRALGLDAGVWWHWVTELLEQHTRLSRAIDALGAGRQDESRALGAAPAKVLRRPASACPGSDALKAWLDALWADYEPIGDAWKRSMTGDGTARRRRGSGADQRRQWRELMPFHDRLPTISVFLVAYPVPVIVPVPPVTCLIAPVDDPAGYTRQVVAAAEALAAIG